MILAQDSRVPTIRATPGWSDISQVFEAGDILRVRVDTSGLIDYAGKEQYVVSVRSVEFLD